MSATKGQLLGIISQLKDELHSVDKMLGMCPDKCVSVGRAWHLCEDLENGLNGAVLYDPAVNEKHRLGLDERQEYDAMTTCEPPDDPGLPDP